MKVVPVALITLMLAAGGVFVQPFGSHAQETAQAEPAQPGAAQEGAPDMKEGDAASPETDPAGVGAPKLRMELNKLETQGDACRTYLVFNNDTDSSFKTLKLDLVVFGTDGIVAKRLAVEAAPLAADKMSLKVFDIGGVACDEIGQLLLNDVTACADQDGEVEGCIAKLDLKSRNEIDFTK